MLDRSLKTHKTLFAARLLECSCNVCVPGAISEFGGD